jgi:agmatinase
MPSEPTFKPPRLPFADADTLRSIDLLDGGAAIFAAPHGTPYEDIDNRPHADTADALRLAINSDAGWRDHWDFDLGAPLLGNGTFKLVDLGDLPTEPHSGASNRALIEAATRAIVARGTVPIMIGGDDSTPIPFIEALSDHAPLTNHPADRRAHRLAKAAPRRNSRILQHHAADI